MFHKNQIRAINHRNGPAMVLAGPGSGKTTVITERIRFLIEQGIPPEEILVVTFTKAAASNMERRFCDGAKMKDTAKHSVRFGTFHSIFYQMLKKEYGNEKIQIITEREKRAYIKQCILRLNIDVRNPEDFISNAISEIQKIKGNLLPVGTFTSLLCGTENIRKIYAEYEKTMRAEGKLDFDDLLLQTRHMLREHSDILQRWRSVYRYILIDEFQDINFLQYEIVKMLAAPLNNIFIVGDDDQSIYGFRGSRPDIMLNFKKDYPNTEIFLLNINYRCSEMIVKRAERLICHNKNRFRKNMTAGRKGGKKVSVRLFANQGEELAYLVGQIRSLLRRGVPAEQIAVLARSNSQLQVIQTALQNNKILSAGKKQHDAVYSGMVLQDISAYVCAAINHPKSALNENADLLFILNKPQRYISREAFLGEAMTFDKLKRQYAGRSEVLKNIENLQFHLKMLAGLTPFAAVNYIRKGAGYEEYLYQYAEEHTVKPEILMRQLDILQQDAGQFDSYREWFDFIQSRQKAVEPQERGVQLLTMHGAKGLEFQVVLIPDANQGIIPSKQILREKDFEEERRLFYVAMTRAADELHILACQKRLGNPLEVSMFVEEMLED